MEEVETALCLMDEYCENNLFYLPEEAFASEMMNDVKALMIAQFGTISDEVLARSMVLCPCSRTSYICPNIEDIEERVIKLQNKALPDQRSIEWYTHRHSLLTASVAFKALGTPAKLRELVKAKKAPVAIYTNTSIEGPMHWGVKYEPVSILYYDHTFKTKVGEFGCITHNTHQFIGASPDGINIDPKSHLYGRMLEVKNPYSRIINGIPKKEY